VEYGWSMKAPRVGRSSLVIGDLSHVLLLQPALDILLVQGVIGIYP